MAVNADSSVQVVSSSRLGYLDFQVNAKRLNYIADNLRKKGFEIAKIDEAREYLLVTILDEAEPAIYKSKPKRTLLTIAGFISGLFLSFFIAFFRSLISLNRNKI